MQEEIFKARPFVPTEYTLCLVDSDWQRREYHALRREVFCKEQQIFSDDDLDQVDNIATPIAAFSCVAGQVGQTVGCVRIHEVEDGHWHGSRLAVHKDHRCVARIGAELIRMAVCTAHLRGARLFTAQVQKQNVPFFRRKKWKTTREMDLHGIAHHEMTADLGHYLPHGQNRVWMLRPPVISE